MTQSLSMPAAANAAMSDAPRRATLSQLSRDAFFMILMIRQGSEPGDVAGFVENVDVFFRKLEAQARKADYSVEQAEDVKYAICAFLDETILNSSSPLRQYVELHPFQFKYFGEHLAGVGFFKRLETLRQAPDKNIDVLEVYYQCLMMGFAGQYRLEKQDELRYLVNTLGQDIARIRGTDGTLAPHWALPDSVSQIIKYEVPLWLYALGIVVICAIVYLVLRSLLGSQVDDLAVLVNKTFGG